MSASLRFRADDPDEALLRELRAPPPLAEAREALGYWQDRHDGLAWRRRAARREARAMVETWRERVREAELAALGSGPFGAWRRALLRPRPRVGRILERLLIAATLASVAVMATIVAIVHALFG